MYQKRTLLTYHLVKKKLVQRVHKHKPVKKPLRQHHTVQKKHRMRHLVLLKKLNEHLKSQKPLRVLSPLRPWPRVLHLHKRA